MKRRHIFAERGFVLFHVDADQAWKNRATPSDNIRRFHEIVKHSQNTVVARALCHKHHSGRDAQRFDHWEHHREELDDLDKPKSQICLHDKHNHDLASQSFPARAVDEVGQSFHETVERLRSSPALVAALAATHPGD